ncbi:MAG: hypothetical protein HYY26_07290 [Acidobacteria bacterium]|nr:hypothetical protein [Acidobacteriota bacterium]
MNARPRRRRDAGVVLILALVALLLIAAVAAAILFMTSGESVVVGNQKIATRTFYAATAGSEEVRFRMLPANQPVGLPPLGLNYTELSPQILGLGANPIIPCTPTEIPNTWVPCNTSTVAAYPARPWNTLYVMNSPAANPPAPANNVNQPAGPTNDPLLVNEVPGPNIWTSGSIQLNAGNQNTSVPYQWVRINLKTERLSGQDIDLDNNVLDDDPIFLYLGRQYRLTDMLAMAGGNQALPPPWGLTPPADSSRACVALTCASPIYVVTAFAGVPTDPNSRRLVRTEVAAMPSFAIDAAILSEPGIKLSGTGDYVGFDQCDPDCPPGNPDYTPPGPPPGLYPNCHTVVPIQSADDAADQTIAGTSADSWPKAGTTGCPPGSVISGDACIMPNAPYPYDVQTLIDMLRPGAVNVPPGNYTGLPSGGVSIGGFPPPPYPANLVTGNGAIPQITYVGGSLKCTGGCMGAGILLVDCPTCTAANPALEFNASMEFYGIIIVNGPVKVLGGGSSTTGCNIYGAMITSGTIDTTVGGSICYRYNSCAQKNMFANRPYMQLAFRELTQ